MFWTNITSQVKVDTQLLTLEFTIEPLLTYTCSACIDAHQAAERKSVASTGSRITKPIIYII